MFGSLHIFLKWNTFPYIVTNKLYRRYATLQIFEIELFVKISVFSRYSYRIPRTFRLNGDLLYKHFFVVLVFRRLYLAKLTEMVVTDRYTYVCVLATTKKENTIPFKHNFNRNVTVCNVYFVLTVYFSNCESPHMVSQPGFGFLVRAQIVRKTIWEFSQPHSSTR